LEIIVVNDGSTDNTEEISKRYNNKIRYFSKENGGVATALNLAIKKAQGEYISWLSHDDYYLPNKISRQIEELRKINDREKVIIFSDAEIHDIHENQETVRDKTYFNNSYSYSLLTEDESIKALLSWDIHGCSLLIPQKAFTENGYFDEVLFTTQDYDLWFKFLYSGYQFYCLPEVLMVTRVHEQQDSQKKWNLAKYEQLRLWKNVKKLFPKSAEKHLINEKIKYFSITKYNISFIRMKLLKLVPLSIKKYIKRIFIKGN
jgi:glycosyltransferase involved in cell wall biosynthesis